MTTQPEAPPRAANAAVAGAMLGVVAMWGLAFAAIKILLRDLSPWALTSGRLTVAVATYAVMMPFVSARPVVRRPGDLRSLLVAGVLGSVGYHLAVNWGEQYIGAGLASLIVSSMPAMVAVLSVFVLAERLNAWRAAGIALAFAGVVVLVASGGGDVSARGTAGALVTLGAPAAWSVYTVIVKPLAERYDGVRLNLYGGAAGALISAPFGIREWRSIAHLGLEGWAWLLFLGVLSTAVSYVVYAWALRTWRATSVATIVYLVPVSSLLWAWALLGEVPGPLAIVGGAAIIGGVVLVQRL